MTVIAIKGIIPANVTSGGTFTVGYPTGYGSGSFNDTDGQHSIELNGATYSVANGKLSASFGATLVTLTLTAGYTVLAGTRYALGLNVAGTGNGPGEPKHGVPSNVIGLDISAVNFGAVTVNAANNIALSQSPAAATLTINGTLATSGVATLDVPRNVVIVSGGNDSGITFLVSGRDVYGAAMSERITGANAGTATGSKAFATVTAVLPSGSAATTVTVGTGVKLGLPFMVGNKGFIIKALVDGVDEVASCTIVAGSTATPSATTGDVRGTIAFNTAPNGTKLLVGLVVGDKMDRGFPPA